MDIICTIGNKKCSPENIFELCEAGMTAARFNFSHMDYTRAAFTLEYIKRRHPGLRVIQDIQGNKLRVGKAFKGEVEVKQGERVIFCSEDAYRDILATSDSVVIPIVLEGDFSLLQVADAIYMKDGTMRFNVCKSLKNPNKPDMIETDVEIGGIVRREKGVNAPGMDRSKLRLTKKDKSDILWGLKHGVDVICISYVCSADIMKEARDFVAASNCGITPKFWTKIETQEGVDNFKSILSVSDGIMLGRGDLSAEIDPVMIPQIQEEIIEIMKKNKKELVIATHILPSMCSSPKPSLAELDAIYHFAKSKVNGLMLTSEITVGQYPILAVKALKKMVNQYA